VALRVYNTLSRQKEDFTPVQPGQVGIYLCGPTVYMNSHVGHMVGPVIFDCVKRYLQYRGFQVRLIINITDVEDKLIDRANQEGLGVQALAERVSADYMTNLAKLGVDTVDAFPRATDHIDEILTIVRTLVDKGFAYAVGGDVYFDITRFTEYGKLSHRRPEELVSGARVEVTEGKRHPGDFALWKGAKPDEPSWESPWGPGRPGWHIECSAMSMKYLGETFDIHGGGLDLVFPHHENEVAQSECYTGRPFAKYWMHNGLMQIDREKMAKSSGKLVTVGQLFERHAPETVRFFLLSTHYRRPIDFSDARIEEVGRGLEGFYRFYDRLRRATGEDFYALTPQEGAPDAHGPHAEFLGDVARHRERFLGFMDDDFNTGGAIGALFDLLNVLNRFADEQGLEGGKGSESARGALVRASGVLRELAGVLGVFREPVRSAQADEGLVHSLMDILTDVRTRARADKQFALADHIRDRLSEIGIALEDRPDATGWRRT